MLAFVLPAQRVCSNKIMPIQSTVLCANQNGLTTI